MKLSELSELYSHYPDGSTEWWNAAVSPIADVTVILDDDPLGGQAVSGVPVYLAWDPKTMSEAVRSRAFFILTSSRSLPEKEAAAVCYEAACNAARAAAAAGKTVQMVCRSDSTLRIHYPAEKEAVASALADAGMLQSGEIFFPFFEEGERYTYGLKQYGIRPGGSLIPVSDMEYAHDRTFGFSTSFIPGWMEMKSGGRIPADSVVRLPLDIIRRGSGEIARRLAGGSGFIHAVADCIEYRDAFSIVRAVAELRAEGRHFMIRTAASGVRAAIFNHPDPVPPCLAAEGRILIVAGSHIRKTTEQIRCLLESEGRIRAVVFDQKCIFSPEAAEAEKARAVKEIMEAAEAGFDVLLETGRERIDLPSASPEEQLALTVGISHAFLSVAASVRKGFDAFIAKGGNTASDLVRGCFGARSALVAGQVIRGVPAWRLPDGHLVAVFAGNVGDEKSLLEAYRRMRDGIISSSLLQAVSDSDAVS